MYLDKNLLPREIGCRIWAQAEPSIHEMFRGLIEAVKYRFLHGFYGPALSYALLLLIFDEDREVTHAPIDCGADCFSNPTHPQRCPTERRDPAEGTRSGARFQPVPKGPETMH